MLLEENNMTMLANFTSISIISIIVMCPSFFCRDKKIRNAFITAFITINSFIWIFLGLIIPIHSKEESITNVKFFKTEHIVIAVYEDVIYHWKDAMHYNMIDSTTKWKSITHFNMYKLKIDYAIEPILNSNEKVETKK